MTGLWFFRYMKSRGMQSWQRVISTSAEDIVIHGNVESGVNIRAPGSITIDGVAEACMLEAGKDIYPKRRYARRQQGVCEDEGRDYAEVF